MSSLKLTDHNKIRNTGLRDQVIKPNVVVSDTKAYVIDMQTYFWLTGWAIIEQVNIKVIKLTKRALMYLNS